MIIEWLRSRMPGYPFRDLPHVHSWSNLSCRDSFFYLGVPWLPELRNLKLETHAEPPGMIASDLGISLINTEPFIRTLQRISSTLGESATWKSLEDSISRLEAEDKATLKECYRRFHGQLRPHVVYPEGGSSVRSRYKYRDSVLKEIARALNDRTNQYFHCFEQANEVLAVLFYLLSTFVIDGCIKHYHEYDSLMVYPGKTAVSTKLVEMTVTVDMDVRKFHRFFYLEDEMPSLSGLMFIAGHSWGTSKEKLAAYLLNDSRDAIDKDTFQYIG
ncbi:MAG: hypothetical protein GY847_04800 [Proteobacteria bacterium]|nr:hypothetical protein [Pseudomonadota bacterium]